MLLASVFKGIGSQGRRLQRSKLRSQLNKIHIRYCHICVTIEGTTLFGGLLADIFIYSYKIVEAFRTLRKVSLIIVTAFECVSYYWVRPYLQQELLIAYRVYRLTNVLLFCIFYLFTEKTLDLQVLDLIEAVSFDWSVEGCELECAFISIPFIVFRH